MPPVAQTTLVFVVANRRPSSDVLFLGLPILIPDNEESVLLGAAILAACASQEFPSVQVQCVIKLNLYSSVIQINRHSSD